MNDDYFLTEGDLDSERESPFGKPGFRRQAAWLEPIAYPLFGRVRFGTDGRIAYRDIFNNVPWPNRSPKIKGVDISEVWMPLSNPKIFVLRRLDLTFDEVHPQDIEAILPKMKVRFWCGVKDYVNVVASAFLPAFHLTDDGKERAQPIEIKFAGCRWFGLGMGKHAITIPPQQEFGGECKSEPIPLKGAGSFLMIMRGTLGREVM